MNAGFVIKNLKVESHGGKLIVTIVSQLLN